VTRPDPDSAAWLRSLREDGEDGVARLRELLLRVALKEVHRRAPRVRISGPELDDIAHQAATDAALAVLTKLDGFRGESRFTTWAYRFVVLEVSSKLGRHFWREEGVRLDVEAWERLPDRFGLEPDRQAEWGELVAALQRAVDEELTPHQRQLFVALVLEGVPLDALVVELGSNRNAIYKAVYDARRKLRSALVANGYLDD
jgi:RNA polymerase sigma-70 factor (ECF subfamily)